MGTTHVVCDTCGRPAKYSHSTRKGSAHVCQKGHTTWEYGDNKPERASGSYEEALGIRPLEDDI